MEKDEKLQKTKIGELRYLNENCWLVKNLNYSPSDRCRYCELKFHNCLFFQYLIISLVLALSIFTLFFLIERRVSNLIVISVFVLIIIYGYFFNKSTDKIIEANFAQRKAYEELKEKKEELEKFYKLTVGRELKMIELKKQIKESEEKLEKNRYKNRSL